MITGVSVVSTGTVRIRPEHVERTRTPLLWWLLTSRRWTAPRPINVYVIETGDGLVLFDTGQDRRSVTESTYFPRGPVGHLFRRLARFDIPTGATLTQQLKAAGHDVANVRVAILSHLHQDHIGGLRELPPSARVLVSAAELRELDKPWAVLNGIMRNHVRLPGVHLTPVHFPPAKDPGTAPFTEAHDVLGDGSLLLLPTPGHTPGSMSLLLSAAGLPPMLFVGDLTYDQTLLVANRVPGVGAASALHKSTQRVNDLAARHPSIAVLAAHDPAAAETLTHALDTNRPDLR